MSSGNPQDRVYCPVCQAKFRFSDGWKAGDIVICPICGQKLKLERTPEGWVGSRPNKGEEREIRDRVDEYARIKGYVFNDMKEELLEGLIAKGKRFGDFFCPCRMEHVPEFMCPCRPTRGGDVDKNGKCYCGLYWKRT